MHWPAAQSSEQSCGSPYEDSRGRQGLEVARFLLTVFFANPGGPAYVRWAGARQLRQMRQSDGGSMDNDRSGFLDTRRAADYLSLSHRTLDGYRVSGDGPAFHRFGNRIRYRQSDLDTWAAGRRATTTAEADRLSSA